MNLNVIQATKLSISLWKNGLYTIKNGWNEPQRMKKKTKKRPCFVIKVLKHARQSNLVQHLKVEVYISPISFSFLVPAPISISYYHQRHRLNLSVMDDSSSLEVIRHTQFLPKWWSLKKKSVNTFLTEESIVSRESLGKRNWVFETSWAITLAWNITRHLFILLYHSLFYFQFSSFYFWFPKPHHIKFCGFFVFHFG